MALSSALMSWGLGSWWAGGLTHLGMTSQPDCKCTSSAPCWPSDAEFSALNESVSGYLIRYTPVGSVCYPDQQSFDEDKCEYVRGNWFSSDFHASDPGSIAFPAWAGNPCPPIYRNGTSVNGDASAGSKGCSQGAYPLYVLNASSIEHVQAVVRFAKDKNLRLNIKSTGHSLEGRSTTRESISIWTHHLLSHEYHDGFRPDACPSSYPVHRAISIAAGARIRDTYEFAYQHGVVVVGGAAEDVGMIGWFTAGGHGPLTSQYGQGSDNVLQVTIVTPDGNVLTANECQNTDLFWAVRGGGGGTFGVITHATMRAYPSPSAVSHQLEIVVNDPAAEEEFWAIISVVQGFLPDLKSKGFSGNLFMDRYPYVPTLTLHWNFNMLITAPELDGVREAELALEPLVTFLDSKSSLITYTSTLKHYVEWFLSWNATVKSEPHGVASAGIAFATRLIPAVVLLNRGNKTSPTLLRRTLQSLSSDVVGFQANVAIHTPSDSSPHLPPSPSPEQLNQTSLPAFWREATLQLFTFKLFPDYATPAEQEAVFEAATQGPGVLLKRLAPASGAYLNEGDAFDPDWRTTYFGKNDEALRRVKNVVDPDGVLWCRSCVGSDSWREDSTGELCRAA
ncbi:FAD binding domain protein [Xylariaceae sp. FL1019]|nr:FAD binding domain protein [Xylariaceae sp. FL1019]